MAQNMGEVIRRLRKERDLTQEELAAQIGVTAQAVSKWENNMAMPDISQVVPLANFFGVSTDTLFDFCSEDKKKDIEEYEKRSQKLRNKGLVSESVTLWREALTKYPGDYTCMYRLANQLFGEAGTSTGDIAEKNAKEGIALCERILERCNDPEIRAYSIHLLAYWYSDPRLSVADEEKAVMYAKMGGSIWTSADILLESAYFTEKSKKQANLHREGNILVFTDCVCRGLSWRHDLSDEEMIRNCKAALTLWQTIIPDGNFLFYHTRIADIYVRIAKSSARMGRKEETLDVLQKAAYHAKEFDSIPTAEQHYTSPFLSSLVYDRRIPSKNYTETEFELLLKELSYPCFDFIRDDPEFIALTE